MTTQPEARRDIVIAGGGMVGVSLALALGHVLPDTLSITLVEGHPLPGPGAAPAYHPSFDARSTALSYSTEQIYRELGVWNALAPGVCAIRSIHVSSRGQFGSALMRAEDYRWQALGHVVENPWLGRTLLHCLQQEKRVEVLSPARMIAARQVGDGVRLQLDIQASPELPEHLLADLLIVADGAGSGLRDSLGVTVEERPYGQHALIANVATAQPHEGCAFERFTADGPLALLPLLPTSEHANRSALVWTLEPAEAERLLAASEGDFAAALQERFGYRLGRFVAVGERHAYPLSLMQAAEQVRRGVAVMGNAAHALHPVAGQGFNLALRDVMALAETLGDAVAGGAGPGDLEALQRYARRQASDQERTIAFSDRLPQLFMAGDPLLGIARMLGLAGLDVVPAAKRQFVHYAAGEAARTEIGHD